MDKNLHSKLSRFSIGPQPGPTRSEAANVGALLSNSYRKKSRQLGKSPENENTFLFGGDLDSHVFLQDSAWFRCANAAAVHNLAMDFGDIEDKLEDAEYLGALLSNAEPRPTAQYVWPTEKESKAFLALLKANPALDDPLSIEKICSDRIGLYMVCKARLSLSV
jgi:hypothetical protein